jgi:hypothetical protein
MERCKSNKRSRSECSIQQRSQWAAVGLRAWELARLFAMLLNAAAYQCLFAVLQAVQHFASPSKLALVDIRVIQMDNWTVAGKLLLAVGEKMVAAWKTDMLCFTPLSRYPMHMPVLRNADSTDR